MTSSKWVQDIFLYECKKETYETLRDQHGSPNPVSICANIHSTYKKFYTVQLLSYISSSFAGLGTVKHSKQIQKYINKYQLSLDKTSVSEQ